MNHLFHVNRYPVPSWIAALALIPSILIAQPRLIKVLPDNATLPDGTLLAKQQGEVFWKWLPDKGNGGVLESRAHELKGNAEPLRVVVDQLTPHADYEVFGYFWAPGFNEQDKDKEIRHWPARFGLTRASMTIYGGKPINRVPWIVSSGSKVGSFLGVSSVMEESSPLKGLDLVKADGDTRLIRARVGVAKADAQGKLAVYVDDFPDSIHCDKTMIDGIAVQPAPKDSKPTAGKGDPAVLHLALRANDWPSAQRELEAGADVNALDARGLSALFHPAISGNQDTVKKLLVAGANPNIAMQSIPPLTAAASTGDGEMVRLLLQAGAEVPATRMKVTETLQSRTAPKKVDVALLHPVIAAIRAGSLETLKALLEKQPDLNLESLGAESNPDSKSNEEPSIALFLVEDAMSQGHDELAAFLIDRGCTLSAGIFLQGYRLPAPRPHALLARAITDGANLQKTLAALLRRHVSPIYKLGPPSYSQMMNQTGIEPWDGLSAAVCVANVELTQQFLPQAENLPFYYEEFLMAMARWHGEPTILSMIEKKFPDAGKISFVNQPMVAPSESAEAVRLLLPRTKPAQTKPRPDENLLTLAVIASPQAGGQGASLEVEASTQKGWTVVDRMDVDKALRESQIANPWSGGEYRFAELGDRMAADLLVLVSRIDGEKIQLLRFEAIDVATGLAVMREHMDAKAFDPKKSSGLLLQKIRAAILSARAGDRPTAITLLPFSVDQKVWSAQSLLGVFRSAVQSEVDATPGLLSVGMNEIKAVGGEQSLGGEGSFWAAAYTLEGGVAALDGGKIAVTLRMQSLQQGSGKAVDHTETGQPAELPSLVAKAWLAMLKSRQLAVTMPDALKAQDGKQKTAEATRLLREAEWLLASRLYSDAVPLLERANLLGAAPEALVQAHYSALIRQIPLLRNMGGLETSGIRITEHPLTLESQQLLLTSLTAAQELLDQMIYYQSRFGSASLAWKTQCFNHTLIALCWMRSAIPAVLPAGVSRETIQQFCESLDLYTTEYFKIQIGAKKPSLLPNGMQSYMRNQEEYVTAAMLHRNPQLRKGWVSLLMAASAVELDQYVSDHQLGVLTGGGSIDRYGKQKMLMEEIARQMDHLPAEQRPLREVELAYWNSSGDLRIAAAKAYCHAVAHQGRTMWQQTPPWIKLADVLDRYGMSFFGRIYDNESLIASIVHEPFGSHDWLSEGGYDWMIRYVVRLERMPYKDAQKRIEANSPWNKLAQRLEAASKLADQEKTWNQVIDAAGLWEIIHGRLIRNELDQHCRRLYSPDIKAGEGLKASLLVDLRKLDPSMPGMFIMPTVDKKNRDVMWLRYQPFEKSPQTGSFPIPLGRHPKVVGIRCDTGEIPVTADILKAFSGNSNTIEKNSRGIYDSTEGFLAQSDELILTSARWPGMNDTGVLIRKDNGQLISLKSPVALREMRDLSYGTMYAFGAVAIGNQFITARRAEGHEEGYGNSSTIPHELIKIDADGTVTPLTQHGRRPQVTPFDPIDRMPKMMVPDGNRVLIIHDWNYAARYSPADNSWQINEGAADQLRNSTKLTVDRDFRHHIFSCHRIPKSDSAPEIIIEWNQTLPDMLALSKRGESIRRLKINLDFPEGFADEIVYSFGARDSENKDQFVSYGNQKDPKKFSIVVLNQTKTHLILAMQVGNGFHWSVGKRTGEYLPLLWSLPIKDLQEGLMKQK